MVTVPSAAAVGIPAASAGGPSQVTDKRVSLMSTSPANKPGARRTLRHLSRDIDRPSFLGRSTRRSRLPLAQASEQALEPSSSLLGSSSPSRGSSSPGGGSPTGLGLVDLLAELGRVL